MSSKLTLQWLGRSSRKEYLKAVYCHPAAVHGVAESDTTKPLNWKYFRAASSDCLGTLSTRHGMAGRYNCSESGTARDWYFTSHLCISRSNGCSTLFRGWGLSEVTELLSSQNSEALWGRGYKLGKAREWWQNASSRNWGSKSLARSNETASGNSYPSTPRPHNLSAGTASRKNLFFPARTCRLSQQLKFPPRRGTGCGKKKDSQGTACHMTGGRGGPGEPWSALAPPPWRRLSDPAPSAVGWSTRPLLQTASPRRASLASRAGREAQRGPVLG